MNRKKFLSIVKAIKVTSHLSYQDFLKAVYKRLKVETDSYSYLKFAEDLGFSPTNVIRLVIAGKRKLSQKSANKIIASLDLKGIEKRYFLMLLRYSNERLASQRQDLLEELISIKQEALSDEPSQKNFAYLSEWFNPVIREMVNLDEFNDNPSWVASRLYFRLLPRQVEKSIELLKQLNLISYSQKEKRYIQSDIDVMPEKHYANLAAAGYHQKMIQMSSEAITRVPKPRRDINAITVAVSEEVAEQIRNLLLETCQKIMDLEKSSEHKEHVYQINIQLFPFTKDNS